MDIIDAQSRPKPARARRELPVEKIPGRDGVGEFSPGFGMTARTVLACPPHFYTAIENVQIALELNDVTPSRARGRAHELLDNLGVNDRASNLPSMSSRGQQQRVAVARALDVFDTIYEMEDGVVERATNGRTKVTNR